MLYNSSLLSEKCSSKGSLPNKRLNQKQIVMKKSAQKQLAAFADDSFYEKVRSAVIRHRASCRTGGKKSSIWFRELGAVAVEIAKMLPKDCSELSGMLTSVRATVRNVPAAQPSSISKPFTKVLEFFADRNEIVTSDLLVIFDKLKELVYRQDDEVQEQGDTAVPVEKDTVQEFDRVPPLEPEELNEIAAPLEWARELDPQQLKQFLNLTPQQLLRFLTAQGYSVREIARELEVSHVGLSHIMRGKRNPSESLMAQIRVLAIFPESSGNY